MGKIKLNFGDDPKEKKKNIARAIIFVLALVIAVFAITNGVLAIGDKDPGYYTLEAARDVNIPKYSLGVTYTEYFEGSTNEIKQLLRTAEKVYSDALLWSYKMFDAKEEFEGFVNLASVNNSVKSWTLGVEADGPAGDLAASVYRSPEFQFAPQVYNAIMDAYEKTCEKAGYNLFAGALYDVWKEILVLDDAEKYDPQNDSYQKERIEKLAQASSELDNFKVVVVSASECRLRFEVKESYVKLLESLECPINIMDLNLLHDTYMMQEVYARMEAAGFNDCVIQTSSGILALNGRNVGSQSSFYRAAVEGGDVYHYVLKDADGREHLRSLYFNVYTGQQHDLAEFTKVDMVGQFDLMKPVWLNLQLMNAQTEAELQALITKVNALDGVQTEIR